MITGALIIAHVNSCCSTPALPSPPIHIQLHLLPALHQPVMVVMLELLLLMLMMMVMVMMMVMRMMMVRMRLRMMLMLLLMMVMMMITMMMMTMMMVMVSVMMMMTVVVVVVKMMMVMMTTTLIYTSRAMQFLMGLMKGIVNNPEVALGTVASDIYKQTLSKYHGMITSGAFTVGSSRR